MDFTRIQKTFYRISEWGGALAILGFPVSVSISQAGVFLALLGWVFAELFSSDRTSPEHRLRFWLPRPLIWIIHLYGVLLVSLVFNAFYHSSFFPQLARGLSSEMRPALIFPIALWVIAYGQEESRKERMEKWFLGAMLITIIAGFLSIFSLYRLSKIPHHLMHGWETSPDARFQHTQMAIGPLRLHLPIGLMNTHLTYAAHLVMMIPFLLFYVLDSWLRSPESLRSRKGLLFFVLLVVSVLVLVLNNGRSAILGLVLATVIGLYYYTRRYWRNRALLLTVPVLGILLIALVVIGVSPVARDKAGEIIGPLLGKSKHTDYQRELLWKATGDVIAENPFVGVGPGAFVEEVEKRTLQYSKENPDMWYAYSVIQRGHAHNDYLHFFAIGGFLAPLFYLFFIARMVSTLLRPTEWGYIEKARWGALVLVAGGLFQGYMLDSETLLPFWLITGYALLPEAMARKEEKQQIADSKGAN